uniref:Uncharacterized protein n=1 Tax=Arundo donax TaxID=35708 RepID=A0A0A9CXR1_ARUDO
MKPMIPKQLVTNLSPPVDLWSSSRTFSRSRYSLCECTVDSSSTLSSAGSILSILSNLHNVLSVLVPRI